MPNKNSANEFYQQIVEGQDYATQITLEHESDRVLDSVQLSPVDKKKLASVIERLPDDMFDAAEGVEDPENAEEELEESEISMSAISEETIEAFEDLVKAAVSHDELTDSQMKKIVENLGFEVLFEVGSEVIEMSFERNGKIKDFHVRG